MIFFRVHADDQEGRATELHAAEAVTALEHLGIRLSGELAKPGVLRDWLHVESLKNVRVLCCINLFLGLSKTPASVVATVVLKSCYFVLQTGVLTFVSPFLTSNHFKILLLQEFRENPFVIFLREG